eukprot:TRINITY_DN26010_c0_g1_i1.p1 TRINITY_DN26010_c0_g1~~TRINITY_DN26010_c0_g1_i1.p1  ORF type:complete len:461 (+),score=127.03 TRINITY_DN26010_c0_g1_i1:76-1383(+)
MRPASVSRGGAPPAGGGGAAGGATAAGLGETLRWLALLAVVSCMLVSICFSYSWSGFKLDLKEGMQWDEATMGTVFLFANVGQNVVVHMGMLSDAWGPLAGCLLCAALKAASLWGMWWAAATRWSHPLFLGLCLLADGQAMAAAIMIGQKEVQRATHPRLSGVASSVCAGAFGLGAVCMTSAYDNYFRPDYAAHFAFAGVVSTACLLACAALLPVLGSPPATQQRSGPALGPSLRQVICSRDYLFIFSGMAVTWGLGMVWNGNLPSFSAAAELADAPAIRSAFFAAKTAGCLAIGPLIDLLRAPREAWYLLVCALMYGAAGLMYASDGRQMMAAAVAGGFAFGAIAALVPLMAKALSVKLMGTLYACAKMGGMITGVVWNHLLASEAQRQAAPGARNCVGGACYRAGWAWVLGSGGVLLAGMAVHALSRPKAKPD